MKLTPLQCEIVMEMCKCNMDSKKTAKAVGIAPIYFEAHCDKIVKATDLDPRKFYELVALKNYVDSQNMKGD